MKRLRSLQQRDGLGIGSLLALTGVLYTAGGHVTAAFGLAAAGAWLLGPPVFAFVLGQTGLAVVLTPASPALLAVGEVALLGLLFSDVAVPAPVPAWSLAVLLGGVVGGAAVLALPTSIPLAATVILTGIGAVSYSVHRYALAIATGKTEVHA
jgi:hypothetical protein